MKKTFTLFIMAFVMLFSTTTYAQCDPPVNLAASYNNNVSTFSWDAVTGAVSYKLQFKFLGQTWGTTELTAANSPFQLTGLMQGADFEWRVRADCGGTFSNYTASLYTTPCPQPSGLNTTNITTSSATLNWVVAPGYNTNISDFVVSYRLGNTSNAWTQIGHTFASSINVFGLTPGTLYEWRVNQNCASYNSSPVIAQFTTATPPCLAPTGLTAVYNNNVTTFSWNGVPGALDYTLQIKYPGYSWTEIEYETNISASPLSLTGIIQSGTFDWRVRTNCNSGSSAYTESQVTIPCPQPSGLNTTNITTNSATVNWTAAPGLNTLISNFYVAYRLAGSTNNWTQAGHTFNSSMNLTGLVAGTAYEWRVYQTCPYFNSSVVISQFTTLPSNGCGTPTVLATTNIGNANATVNWSGVSGANSYWLQYRAVGATAWIGVSNITGTSYTLNNCLSTGTTYQFQVRSKCGSNYSAYSPLSSFTTLNCVTYGNNSSEWIDLFKLGGINRGSGAEPGGYKNTGLSANLVIGSSNSGQISAGFNGAVRNQNYAVYIDFNRNGSYDDAGERVFGAGLIASAGNCNFSAVIPGTATAGITGMRVVMRKTTDGPVMPCLTGFLGETEDYTVTLVASSSRNSGDDVVTITDDKIQAGVTISPNPSAGLFTIQLPGNSQPVLYEVININGSVVQKQNIMNKTLFSIDITRMPKGMYLLRITGQSGRQEMYKLLTN